MGGRARDWAGATREGRSLAMGEEWVWASDADITNLGLGLGCSMGFFGVLINGFCSHKQGRKRERGGRTFQALQLYL